MTSADLARRWHDPAFWRDLNRALSLEETVPIAARRRHRLGPRQLAQQRALLKDDGYINIQGVMNARHVDPMANGVRRLSRLGIPIIFAFVYDEFWSVILELTPILTGVLGRRFVVLPDVWTWLVDRRHPTNFPPHRDDPFDGFLDSRGMPTAITIWVPLTDVSTCQSCMHVVPRAFDPRFPARPRRSGRADAEVYTLDDLVNVRALPARKGSVLGWNLGVLHWGSRPRTDARERISIGYYLQARTLPTLNTPCVDLGAPLPLTTRLGLIGKQIYRYSRDRRPRLIRMARELMEYLPPGPTTSGRPLDRAFAELV